MAELQKDDSKKRDRPQKRPKLFKNAVFGGAITKHEENEEEDEDQKPKKSLKEQQMDAFQENSLVSLANN